VELDPTRMCLLLVGLVDVKVLGVEDRPAGPIVVHVEQAGGRPVCLGCGRPPVVKDRQSVELFDLPCFGRKARLGWRKVRFACPNEDCPMTSWTWGDDRIAAPRQVLTDRAARWATLHVGGEGVVLGAAGSANMAARSVARRAILPSGLVRTARKRSA
jgi:transposase